MINKKTVTRKKLNNHIEEYFANQNQNKDTLTSKELFRASEEDVDIKTDINFEEILIIAKLKANDRFFKKHKLKQIYKEFIREYLRLKISLDRKSRGEFVDMNRSKTNTDDILDVQSKIKNIADVKK